jgi:hypothetical protein
LADCFYEKGVCYKSTNNCGDYDGDEMRCVNADNKIVGGIYLSGYF